MLNNYWVTLFGRKNLVPLKVKKRKEMLAFYFEGKQKYIFFKINQTTILCLFCSDHLKIHVKTHDTRKPFQCSVCQRGYSTAAALTSHMLNHRRESGSRCGSLCSSTSSVSAASTTCSSATPNHGRSASSNASTPCPTSLPSSSPVSPPPTPTNDAPSVRTMSPSTAIKQHPPPSSVTPPMELPNSPASPPISQYQVRGPTYCHLTFPSKTENYFKMHMDF